MINLIIKLLHLSALTLALSTAPLVHSLPAVKTLEKESFQYPKEKDKLFVMLWATWCSDCKEKLSDAIPAQLDNPNVSFLALNTEQNVRKVKQYISKEKVQVPVALDLDRNFRKELTLLSVPSWAVFKKDPQGVWQFYQKGEAFDTAQINQALGENIF